MQEAVQVFVSGVIGVFGGMALVYLSVRVVSVVVGRIMAGKEAGS